jgi:hypothetical protein
MDILVIAFCVCIVALAWAWHNQPARRHAEPPGTPAVPDLVSAKPKPLGGGQRKMTSRCVVMTKLGANPALSEPQSARLRQAK